MGKVITGYEVWCPSCGEGRVNAAMPPTTCPKCEKAHQGLVVLTVDQGMRFRFKIERRKAQGQA